MRRPLNMIKDEQPWYEEGLRFKCTECGRCCTGSPGYVWVTEQEIVAIAQYLELSVEDFTEKFIRIVGNKLALLEHPGNYDCVFLKDKKCQIYPVRPSQCRTFPWWSRNLKTEADWKAAAEYCEGINPNAALVPLKTIQEQLNLETNGSALQNE